MPFKVWRKVKSVNFVQSKNSIKGIGSNMLYLSCGHYTRRKTSIAIPNKALCSECGLSTGSTKSF